MQTGDKFYCPRCGAEYYLYAWDRFEFEEFGRFDTVCDGCGVLFRTLKGENGEPFSYC
jgi:rubredoxin